MYNKLITIKAICNILINTNMLLNCLGVFM